jgi:fibronectin type 3 domain-containing protein
VDGNNFVQFLWSNGATATSIDVAIEGEYSATLIDANGCVVNTSPVFVSLNPLGVDEICYVDYNTDNGAVFLHWNASLREGIVSYNVYRDNSGTGAFQLIANVEETVSSFNDPQVLSFDLPLSYQVSILDTCGVEGPRSVVHAPIRMRAVSNGFVQLNWTPYQGAEVWGYNIQRRVFGTLSFSTIASVDANTSVYIDNSEQGNFEYMITATGSTCGELFLLDNLHSNIELASITSVVEQSLPAATLYPNPSTNNEVVVQVESGWIGARVNVVDALGKTISNNVIRTGNHMLELNGARAGVYFVILTAENGNTKTMRLVIE